MSQHSSSDHSIPLDESSSLRSGRDVINTSKNIQVRSVGTSDELKLFYRLQFSIYKDVPQWVAPFWFEFKQFFNIKNPFWQHADYKLFIVYKNDKAVGRIAAIIDTLYCKTYHEKTGFFGFFECINDFASAKALFTNAEAWLLSKGMKIMRGPIDGRIDVGCGFLYDGFDSPATLLSSYNPSYYPSFCEKYDMKKCRDFFEYRIDLHKPLPANLDEKALQCAKDGVTIRPFKRFRTNKELKWWVSLFLETFDKHWGYVPVPEEEVRERFGVKQLRWTVDPDLFLIAEHQGTPIAYLWGTPDYNQVFQHMNGGLGFKGYINFFLHKKGIDTGKLHLIGIKQHLRHHNIGSYLNYMALLEMQKRGYTTAIVGSIDENNKNAHDTIHLTGAKIYKKFRVFEKQINERS